MKVFVAIRVLEPGDPATTGPRTDALGVRLESVVYRVSPTPAALSSSGSGRCRRLTRSPPGGARARTPVWRPPAHPARPHRAAGRRRPVERDRPRRGRTT